MSAIYRATITVADKFVPRGLRPLWEHAAGPKTIFFWAPAFKWGLVMAGIGDLQRPADTISVRQSATLAATGVIWSRYCLVIIPKNYSLCAVNVFVALTQSYQAYKGLMYEHSQKSLKDSEKSGIVKMETISEKNIL